MLLVAPSAQQAAFSDGAKQASHGTGVIYASYNSGAMQASSFLQNLLFSKGCSIELSKYRQLIINNHVTS
jgi:hypothetical protein